MNKTWIVVCTIILFIASFVLVFYYKPWILVRLSPQATVNPQTAKEQFSPHDNIAFFDNEPFLVPKYVASMLAQKPAPPSVLGESTEDKRIEIDLTNQRLYAFEGERKVYDFLISSGKWGKTPTGIFNIWVKLRATKMEGGSKELRTYYYLPNVPYVMYFSNNEIPKWRGFGIHGAYWHSNFGHPMSHGCINMKIEEAGLLYEWAAPNLSGKSSIHASDENPGTTVVIYGNSPNS